MNFHQSISQSTTNCTGWEKLQYINTQQFSSSKQNPKRNICNATTCCNKPILHNNTQKVLNPENKSMICKQKFHTCSRFHGLLYFMHLICTLSLMYTSCILRSHPPSFYNIFLLIKKKKNKKNNVAYLKLRRKISLHEQ